MGGRINPGSEAGSVAAAAPRRAAGRDVFGHGVRLGKGRGRLDLPKPSFPDLLMEGEV